MIKRKDTAQILALPAPARVVEGSRADVSFAAGLLMDKFADGYAAYQQYAEKTGINHARCWSHGRRGFFDALTVEPTGAAEAFEQIKAMYAVEEEIRELKLAGEAKQLHRLTHNKPLVELFFEWVDRRLERQGFTPTNPFIQALNYVGERRGGPRSLPHRSGCPHRHKSSGGGITSRSPGQNIVVILLDRARCQARRHHPELDPHLPTPRRVVAGRVALNQLSWSNR